LKYHNVTPPAYFTGVSSEFEKACQIGRAEVGRLGTVGFDLHLGDSSFNIDDLRNSSDCEGKFLAVPPFHHTDALINQPADVHTLSRLNDDFMNIVCVGRLVPNKGHLDLVRAFSHYYHDFNERARLLLIGGMDPRVARYTGELRDLVAKMRLETAVQFLGAVPPEILKVAYLTADLLLMCSQHEGFCVPLVEAMAFRVPIIALDAGAVGETLGDAGIVWEEFDEHLFSVSMNRVLSDPETSLELGLRGQRRYKEEFSSKIIEKKLSDALSQIGVQLG
jgi:glycosyltransferase involved in cell wall biosynthesis